MYKGRQKTETNLRLNNSDVVQILLLLTALKLRVRVGVPTATEVNFFAFGTNHRGEERASMRWKEIKSRYCLDYIKIVSFRNLSNSSFNKHSTIGAIQSEMPTVCRKVQHKVTSKPDCLILKKKRTVTSD